MKVLVYLSVLCVCGYNVINTLLVFRRHTVNAHTEPHVYA